MAKKRVEVDHYAVAAACREGAGEAVYVKTYAASYTARNTRYRVVMKPCPIPAYREGEWDAEVYPVDEGWALWVRFLGEREEKSNG